MSTRSQDPLHSPTAPLKSQSNFVTHKPHLATPLLNTLTNGLPSCLDRIPSPYTIRSGGRLSLQALPCSFSCSHSGLTSIEHTRTCLLLDHLLFTVPREYLLETSLAYCPTSHGSLGQRPRQPPLSTLLNSTAPPPPSTRLPPHPSPSVTPLLFSMSALCFSFSPSSCTIWIIFICLNLPTSLKCKLHSFVLLSLGPRTTVPGTRRVLNIYLSNKLMVQSIKIIPET